MKNLKTLMVCGLMLLPSLSNAQSCCQGKKEVKKCAKQEHVSSCGKTSCCEKTVAPTAACCQMNNEVIQTIMARHSIRKYQDKPVEHEKLALIAKCGIHAPSAMNQQTWAVRVVENPDFIKGTTEIFKKENPEQVKRDANFKNMYRNAPNIIIVACPKDDHYATLNVGLMGENMMLAAQSLGLGTCCLGSAAMFLQRSKAYKPYIAQLNLPADYEICYILAVGYPDEAPAAKPRDESKIEFIK